MNPEFARLFKDRQDRRRVRVKRTPERRRQERRNDTLAWIPIFRDVSASMLRDALAYCEVLELPAGTHLLTPGEPNHNIFIPLAGTVVVRLNNGADGTADIPIANGECVGELSAIDGKAVSALVLAQSDVRVLKISAEVFWNGLMTMPHIARNLQKALTDRLRKTNEIALKAQREHLELAHLRKELTVATQLQASMLPLQRPIFQERQELDVCGFMEPASSVGGDLFDAFFVDDHMLFFCIGDVSGHGVASALFMARAIGLLRLLAIKTSEPQQLLKELNERLCIANETNIFLTIFCGFYDVRNGALSYSNGGHCPPLLLGPQGARFLPVPKGPLIGAFEGIVFGCAQTVLQPGELLFCYTDGVTEAQTPTGEEYSEERATRLLERNGQLPLPELLDSFRADVQRFTEKSVLDDDCTMLAVRRTVAAF
ncbi:MAG: SpoIIE family protein phosphatase [Rhodoferax sp.]|nr:SpoIIE family protein phosphatase [Rhodoferax sp.]